MKYIERPFYTERIKPFIGKQIIKVLTGQRRVGKSYIMFQLMDFIKEEDPSANIVYINLELEQFAYLRTSNDLNEYLRDKFPVDQANYLFIDEVQEIDSFQLTFRSLFAENKCDIFCTGSNARMLSGELATLLSGRYVEISIHSLSYTEFLTFHQLVQGYESVLKYLTYGGMPYLPNIGLEDDLPFEYLKNVYSTILLKDVVSRENIRNISFLENLVLYLSDNIGSLFSANNISKFLKSQRIEISPQLTMNYLRALSNAYFVHKVVRSEVGGLKVFEIGEKYYFEDLGLRNALKGFNVKTDIHKLLENAVYLYLVQNGYRVFVGKIVNREIDFVAERNGLKVYVQVCLQITEKATLSREFGNLMLINDNYPKYVVTLNDPIVGNDYQGIKQMNLLDFLLLKL
jgi:predicted AAA+ superfamily ATPase